VATREWLARVFGARVSAALAPRVWASLVPVPLPRVQALQGWEPGPWVWVSASQVTASLVRVPGLLPRVQAPQGWVPGSRVRVWVSASLAWALRASARP